MTIRDNKDQDHQFIYFDASPLEKTFIQKGMSQNRVYWIAPREKSVSQTVLPLLAQITDEIIQSTIEEHPETQWLKVYFGKDPYCQDCTPILSQYHATGYIHHSQLKMITELEQGIFRCRLRFTNHGNYKSRGFFSG